MCDRVRVVDFNEVKRPKLLILKIKFINLWRLFRIRAFLFICDFVILNKLPLSHQCNTYTYVGIAGTGSYRLDFNRYNFIVDTR